MDLLQEERFREIIKSMENNNGVIRVDYLTDKFGISSRTVRRDLEKLEETGVLTRTYGGAVLNRNSTEPDFDIRESHAANEKKRIGKKASEMIKDGDTIILDSGTTVINIIPYIKGKRNLVVVTNAINIASALSGCQSISVVVVGGTLRQQTLSLVGPETEESIRKMHVDKSFIGTSGLSANRGFTNSNLFEAGVKRLMMQVAKKSIVLADYTKFGVSDFTAFASSKETDILITDTKAPDEEVKGFIEQGVEVMII